MSLLALSSHAADSIRVRLKSYSSPIKVLGMNVVLHGQDSPFKRVSLLFPSLTTIEYVQTPDKPIKGFWKIEGASGSKNIQAPALTLEGKSLRVNNFKIPPKAFLWPKKNGRVDLIAVLDLEEYMEGVLPSEMPASWPREALKAQAIASRSYALKQMQVRKSKVYDVDASTNDQMYEYQKSELALHMKQKIKEVLAETKGMVLKERGQVLKAYYHSDCGGKTETSHNVWKTGRYTATVNDPFCPSGGKSLWEHRMTKEEFEEIFGEVQSLQSIYVSQKTASGRVGRLSLKDREGNRFFITGQNLRRKVGYNKIKSTFFKFKYEGKSLIFVGTGHGHGVGLCQWGTKAWAQNGLNFKQILSHYYPQAKVVVQ